MRLFFLLAALASSPALKPVGATAGLAATVQSRSGWARTSLYFSMPSTTLRWPCLPPHFEVLHPAAILANLLTRARTDVSDGCPTTRVMVAASNFARIISSMAAISVVDDMVEKTVVTVVTVATVAP